MDDNKRSFIMMIVLSAAVLLFFWIRTFFSPPEQPEEVPTTTTEEVKSGETSDKTTTLNLENANFEYIEIPQEKEYDLVFENDNIKIEFDARDAVIKHAYVKDTFLKRKINKQYDIVQAMDDKDGALQLRFGSWDSELTLSELTGGNNTYHYERKDNVFIFKTSFKNKNDDTIYTVEKKYTFIDDEFVFKLDVNMYNDKNVNLSFDKTDVAYSLGWGPLLGIDSTNTNKAVSKRQTNILSYYDGKKLHHVKPKKKALFSTVNKTGVPTWVASNGHYFSAIIYPDKWNYLYFFDYRQQDDNKFYSGISRNVTKTKIDSSFYIYIGPKLRSLIKKNYNSFNKGDFELSETQFYQIDKQTPVLGQIGEIIGIILMFIHNNIVSNYGIAIILLTILIKLILFPLTHKSMVSQQRMSKLQPKIKELQERFKDKPDQLNKETMKLYKKEGINPLGGCLPLLLQMPILLAMYGLLSKMVALKDASFLWISDLSQPDAIYTFATPIFNIQSINILPVLMVAVQIVSSLLMPDAQSNKQAKIMIWTMPIVFFFILYNVASGLVLYWTIMNILNLVQQVITNNLKKKTEVAKA